MKKTLIISKDESIKERIKLTLKSLNANLVGDTDNLSQARRLIESYHPTLIVCDMNVQGIGDGIEMIKQINQDYIIPVVYIAPSADASLLSQVQDTPVAGILIKPLIMKQLEVTLELSLRSQPES